MMFFLMKESWVECGHLPMLADTGAGREGYSLNFSASGLACIWFIDSLKRLQGQLSSRCAWITHGLWESSALPVERFGYRLGDWMWTDATIAKSDYHWRTL
ncbi:unnamed protein product [Symbiodinium microadriaticum]|nr:unnamed protein product [Symbiodinium microadriaticum]CAE7950011.1 unnamed protein product [Symbiodinium sp. KB8]